MWESATTSAPILKLWWVLKFYKNDEQEQEKKNLSNVCVLFSRYPYYSVNVVPCNTMIQFYYIQG